MGGTTDGQQSCVALPRLTRRGVHKTADTRAAFATLDVTRCRLEVYRDLRESLVVHMHEHKARVPAMRACRDELKAARSLHFFPAEPPLPGG